MPSALNIAIGAPSVPSGFPDSTNTGYLNAPDYPGSLTAGGSIASSTTYNFKSYSPRTSVGTDATPVSNVTFHGCRFKGQAVEDYNVITFGTNIKFEYCSFEPNVSSPPTPYANSYQFAIGANGGGNSFADGLTVEYCDIWGFGNAIDFTGGSAAHPMIFQHNYIHDSANDGGSYHTDGIGMTQTGQSADYVTINHNTIVAAGNTNGIALQEGTYDHITITNNLFSGFGATVALWSTSTNVVFTDNTYSTLLTPVWGPLYPSDFWSTGTTWRRNIWSVPGDASWGDPAHDGWYWVPDATLNSGASDTPFVSLTDYTG